MQRNLKGELLALSYLIDQFAGALQQSGQGVRPRMSLKARMMGLARAAISAHPAAVLLRVSVALSVAMWLVHLAKAHAG
jgi:hypothetical protein